MIAMRKPRTYQDKGDPRKNNGKTGGERGDNHKGRSGGNQGSTSNRFNKEGFKISNNSRYGVLENLEEEDEETNEDEAAVMGRTENSTSTVLAGKGKRAQIQVTEAQIMNDKAKTTREDNKGSQNESREREGKKSTLRNKAQTNRAAETESHTVVRGFEKGARVETTTINEDGRRTEVQYTQTKAGDHHQDPPDEGINPESDDTGEPMMEVEFNEGQSSEGSGGAVL
nr:uncharacterized protein LOC109158743 [Ipomoea batatas]